MELQQYTEHSPLGGSGAYRWLPCPGSVRLSHGIPDEESEYATLGTEAHTLAERCLRKGNDAWEYIKKDEVDPDMANAVQMYLNAMRDLSAHEGSTWIELPFHCPDIHELFWGKADFVHLKRRDLYVTDYKHGAGIVIDIKENPQLMYYGIGVLQLFDLWDRVDNVILTIVQPRGFHFDGPIRTWTTTPAYLSAWRDYVLVPGMDRALAPKSSTAFHTESGEHCRFCPARQRACPQLVKDYDEIEEMLMEFDKKDTAPKWSNEQLGRVLALHDVSKIASKAANKTAFNRMNAGVQIPGRKLVKTKANREWKDNAEKAMAKTFGPKAFKEQKLKSPSQVEEMVGGKAFATRYAFNPDAGFTVVADGDSRGAIIRDVGAMFPPVGKTA